MCQRNQFLMQLKNEISYLFIITIRAGVEIRCKMHNFTETVYEYINLYIQRLA